LGGENMDFLEKLSRRVEEVDSLLCVGLDIDEDKMPGFLFESTSDPYLEFNRSIVDATSDLVCAYKMNLAFYESLGEKGLMLLKRTVRYIPRDIVVILDGKRNDIGNTARMYAKALFEEIGGDAVTLNPYLGLDGIKPFLMYPGKCSFILCRTSNPSAGELQDLLVDGRPLYHHVAEKILEWNKIGLCGAVVGATYPMELKEIREILGEDIPLLIPGIGKQGGDIEATVKYGTNSKGEKAIINSSRGIIFAGSGEDYAEKSREAAVKLRDMINLYRREKKG